MTNKEAIRILKEVQADFNENWVDYSGVNKAFNLAFEALERDGSLSYDEVITSVFSCPVCGAIWREEKK